MLSVGAPRAGSSIGLSRPSGLHATSSHLLATGRCLRRAPQQARVRSSSTTTITSGNGSLQSPKAIFDRVAEREQLDSLQHTCPGRITVVLGPRSCGKTALLHELFAKQANAVYVDCRTINVATPEGLIQVLLNALAAKVPDDLQTKAVAALKSVLGAVPGFLTRFKLTEKDAAFSSSWSVTVQDLVQAFLGSPERQENPNAVYAVLRKLLNIMEEKRAGDIEEKRAGNGSKWPVVVIDEANVLMAWNDKYPGELKSFLNNLVVLTKQQHRCHVLLATSEYAFQAWLRDAIGSRFWVAEVIGDFPEAVAREFLERELEQHATSSVLDDQAWRKVFQVCGGNAGDLKFLALVIDSMGGRWDAALEVLWRGELLRNETLALGGDGWTAAQYADIMLQLLDAKYHALPVRQAWMLLGQHMAATTPQSQETEGAAVLQRLVEANALSVRPKSAWATDIPEEAFADAKDVVTAPSSLELHCVSQLRGRLEKALQQWQQEQAQQQQQAQQKHQQQDLEQVGPTTRSNDDARASRPPSPTSQKVAAVEREIADVKACVTAVEQQITSINHEVAEVRRDKAEGWQEELAYLREEKQQLVEKEKQLREQLGLLQQEKLLLLKREDHE